MATSSTYCTHAELKRIFPQIDEFDQKTPVYGWIEVSTDKYAAHDSGKVSQLFVDGEDLGPAQSAHTDLNVEGEWFYNSAEDVLYYFSASTPLDKLMEVGEEFATMVSQILSDASRYLDARLDANLPRDQFKDKEGNYDYLIVRTTALISGFFLVNSDNPNSELATQLMEEVNFNIDQLNSGKTRLSGNVSGDASKGIVREVESPQNANGLHIVDTRGNYTGIYDLLKIIVSTGGAIGTGKFDVYESDGDGLKASKIVDAVTINGQYQSIGRGLQIRFAGKNDSSVSTANDEWELEVWGHGESMDDNLGSPRSIRKTRRYNTRYRL